MRSIHPTRSSEVNKIWDWMGCKLQELLLACYLDIITHLSKEKKTPKMDKAQARRAAECKLSLVNPNFVLRLVNLQGNVRSSGGKCGIYGANCSNWVISMQHSGAKSRAGMLRCGFGLRQALGMGLVGGQPCSIDPLDASGDTRPCELTVVIISSLSMIK
ncbi:hypothetical protein RND71_001068 [Anisodus tanguticus]|uniref:Uncharacterized protein n=1 Tax=Anisodus tanguticus TaxID=243964 RepID=A0AAE1T284_9SOLA|nr:hypothetical protein RND71_001068 [Anisodus tanguticus]